MKEVFEYDSQNRISSRNNNARLQVPFRKATMWQKILIFWSLSLEQRKETLAQICLSMKKDYLQELRM